MDDDQEVEFVTNFALESIAGFERNNQYLKLSPLRLSLACCHFNVGIAAQSRCNSPRRQPSRPGAQAGGEPAQVVGWANHHAADITLLLRLPQQRPACSLELEKCEHAHGTRLGRTARAAAVAGFAKRRLGWSRCLNRNRVDGLLHDRRCALLCGALDA